MKKIFIAVVLLSTALFSAYSYAQPEQYNVNNAKKYFENKLSFTTGPAEVSRMLQNKDNHIQVVDVRDTQAFAKGHVPGAINLPSDSWDNAHAMLDKNKVTIIYCYSQACHLATRAAAKLAAEGYHVQEMEGGYQAWVDHNLEVQHS